MDGEGTAIAIKQDFAIEEGVNIRSQDKKYSRFKMKPGRAILASIVVVGKCWGGWGVGVFRVMDLNKRVV